MSSPQPLTLRRLAASLAELSNKVDRLESRLDALDGERSHQGLTADARSSSSPADSLRAPRTRDTDLQTSSDQPIAAALERKDHASPVAQHPRPEDESPFIYRDEFDELEPPSSQRLPRLSRDRFEWMLGAKGLALLGMLIVVVGLGMFLKYAYNQGWLGQMSPIARCIVAAGFGAALLGTGEILRRRINALASSGITATGIVVVYSAILAASRLYELIGTTTTFALLVGITTLGVLLGSLSNRVMLSLLSLFGAFLVPFMLPSNEPSLVAMPLYLLSLLLMGLVLAGWRGGSYAHARRLAWWGAASIGSLWAAATHDLAPVNVTVFVILVWLATVIELIVAARFFNTQRDRRSWPEGSKAGFVLERTGEIRFDLKSLLSPEARWLNSVFGVTAWAVIAASLTIRQITPGAEWLAPLGFGLASVAIAFITLRLRNNPLARLWSTNPTPRSALAAALALNSAMLLVATVAMSLGGLAQVCTWGAIGLAAIETSRRLRFRVAGVFGFGLVAIAIARLGTLDLPTHIDAVSIAQPFGLYLTSWSLQVLYVAGILAAAAWRSRYTLERHIAASATIWALAAMLAHQSASLEAIGATWLLLALAGGWLATRLRFKMLLHNAYLLGSLGTLAVLASQFELDADTRLGVILDLKPIPTLVSMLAWIGFAAIPGSQYRVRTACASLAVATGAIALASIHHTRGVPETLLAGVLYIGLLLLLSKRLFRWSIIDITGGLLAVLTGGWLWDRLSAGGAATEGVPIANAPFIAATCATAAWMLLARLLRTLPRADDAPPGLADFRSSFALFSLGVAWPLLLIASSLEISRATGAVLGPGSAQGAALSIWWSLYAVASVAMGFRLSAALRWTGLSLLGVVAVKVLLLDTQTLQPPARIIAAISVGLVIIGTGVLYAKLMKQAQSTEETDDLITTDDLQNEVESQ